MKKYDIKTLDVRGDGSCFFRALYHGATSRGLLTKVIARLHRAGESKDAPPENATEDQFVKYVRLTIAHAILARRDKGVVRNAFKFLGGMDEETYDEALESTFPDWFVKVFKDGVGKSEREFRATVAKGVLKTGNWAGQIDLEILNKLLGTKMRIVVLNSSGAVKKLKPIKGEIYVLNHGEVHYNAVLVKKTEAKKKTCEADKVLNPKTQRCVLKNSCKGYEVRFRLASASLKRMRKQ